MNWEIKKLKTWQQIEKEFKYESYTWDVRFDSFGGIRGAKVTYKDKSWTFNRSDFEKFGKEIKVKKRDSIFNYNHDYIDEKGIYYSSLWFEEYEFLSEEEMML